MHRDLTMQDTLVMVTRHVDKKAPLYTYHCERCRCRVKWAMGDESFDSDGVFGSLEGNSLSSGSQSTKSWTCGCSKW